MGKSLRVRKNGMPFTSVMQKTGNEGRPPSSIFSDGSGTVKVSGMKKMASPSYGRSFVDRSNLEASIIGLRPYRSKETKLYFMTIEPPRRKAVADKKTFPT
jgi:hypothetical protein